ncbi:hypothetical protein NQ317_007941 [Molorchus minor]|uniref:Uncharacterized protein n=1 Tax=Molorchus minor TaxID=1323400 RepID=A0ABQ9JR31_9CUCU|nr:hypothetical protein NQ317_007941 [Molorchus minor]
MKIPDCLKDDISWWKMNTFTEFFSDASLQGWGAYCNGQRANEQWNFIKKTYHINRLELLAAYFVLKCFASKLKDCDILLRIEHYSSDLY